MALATKIENLDLLKNGEKIAYVAKQFQVNESTIRTIKSNEVKIEKVVIRCFH